MSKNVVQGFYVQAELLVSAGENLIRFNRGLTSSYHK